MSQTKPRTENPDDRGVIYADEPARQLLDGAVAQIADPTADNWRIVKRNASRTVYRGTVADRGVYLKHFRSRHTLHRLGKAIGHSDALHELAFIQYLRDRGVETTPPLAACCTDGLEWLATEEVAPAMQADSWHAEMLRQGARGRAKIRQAAAELGRLVGRMHRAGVYHCDLHCGNVLVRTDREQPELVLIDLHRAKRHRRLSRRLRARNLAHLHHDRRYFTTRSDRLRFLRAYLQASGGPGSLRGWAMQVEMFSARHTRRQHAQRERRTTGNNRYFSRVDLSCGWKGHVVLASKRQMAGSKAADCVFTPDQWKQVLADPHALLKGEGVEVIKDSPSGKVVRRKLTVGEHELDVYIKAPRRKQWWKVLADCFRPSRSLRAFRLGHALLTRHIATAMPLAAIEKRTGPLLREHILITEAVDVPRLNDFLGTWLGEGRRGNAQLTNPQQRQLAQEVLWQLGRLVQHLHDNRFVHRDLKATNILVRYEQGEAPELVLIDLDGLRRVRYPSAKRRFQGIMRLNVSLLKCPEVNHAGRLRMLLGYLRRPGVGRINFKPYWRVLETWSAEKLRRQIRSRRIKQREKRRPGS